MNTFDDFNSNNEFDVIANWKKFERRSRKMWKKVIDRIKDDKKYLGGEQLTEDDITILGKDRAANQLNVVSNAVRTIVNTYREQPYRWNVIDNSTQKNSDTLNAAGNAFMESPENSTATLQALESCVSFGLGVLVVTTDYGVDGNPEPSLFSVTVLDNVYLDPELTKLNGAVQTVAAIVELKS